MVSIKLMSPNVWLPMIEGAGTTIYDASGNNHNGTSTSSNWSKTKNGVNVLKLNGTSDTISCPYSTDYHLSGIDFTICFWVRILKKYNTYSTSYVQTIVQQITNGVNGWGISVFSGARMVFYGADGTGTRNILNISGSDLKLGEWYFCYLTKKNSTNNYDGNTNFWQKLIPQVKTEAYGNNTSNALLFGYNSFYSTNYAEINIGDFMIFKNKILSYKQLLDIQKQTYRE